MRNKEDIISYEVMGGWPMYKMTLREIIEDLGFQLIDGKWQIDDNNEILNTYPRVCHDDGMGYSPTIEYVISADAHLKDDRINETFCNLFAEEPLEKLELWKNSKFHPCSFVHKLDDNGSSNSSNELTICDIKEENGILFYKCYKEHPDDGEWFSEKEIDYGW